MVRALLLVGAPTCSTCGVWTADSWSGWFRCPPRSEPCDSWNFCLTALTEEPARYTDNKTPLSPPLSPAVNFVCFSFRVSLNLFNMFMFLHAKLVHPVDYFLFRVDAWCTEPGRHDALHQHSHLQAALPHGFPWQRNHHSDGQPQRPTCCGHHG